MRDLLALCPISTLLMSADSSQQQSPGSDAWNIALLFSQSDCSSTDSHVLPLPLIHGCSSLAAHDFRVGTFHWVASAQHTMPGGLTAADLQKLQACSSSSALGSRQFCLGISCLLLGICRRCLCLCCLAPEPTCLRICSFGCCSQGLGLCRQPRCLLKVLQTTGVVLMAPPLTRALPRLVHVEISSVLPSYS